MTTQSEETARRIEEIFADRLQKEVEAAYARGQGEAFAATESGLNGIAPRAPVEAIVQAQLGSGELSATAEGAGAVTAGQLDSRSGELSANAQELPTPVPTRPPLRAPAPAPAPVSPSVARMHEMFQVTVRRGSRGLGLLVNSSNIITELTAGGQAAQEGQLAVGDLVVAVDGVAMYDAAKRYRRLKDVLSMMPVKDDHRFSIQRTACSVHITSAARLAGEKVERQRAQTSDAYLT